MSSQKRPPPRAHRAASSTGGGGIFKIADEFEYCVLFKIVVVISDETELGLDDGAEVPSMLVLSAVKLLSIVIVSLTTTLNLVTSVFTTVPFETVLSVPSFGLVSFVESRVSSPDCFNQRQAEYSSHIASLPK